VIPTNNEKADDLELYKLLIQKPNIAWPTILLLVAAFTIFSMSTFAFLKGALPLGWAMLINSIASYMSFSIAHDATHSAVFTNRRMNDWTGRLAMILLEPGPFFQVFRFVHMKHHRFTNDSEKDPDVYCGTGPRWLLPFKWLTLDLFCRVIHGKRDRSFYGSRMAALLSIAVLYPNTHC